MVNKMSLVEMVNITTGTGWQQNLCVGNTGPANSVGFPSLCLQDGPLGIRFADHITAFPAGLTVGATWSRDLMYRRGKALGEEARLKGINVLLGPSMGPLGKVVAGGRNWEGFGADPVLQGVAAAETIMGIQEEGVMATAKHYIVNEQEHFRQSFEWGLPNAISSNVDDRTLHELYLWPFAESIKAGVASVMCSYNQVNNSYACGNSKLLNGILKDELGFQGFVQSDWLGQRSGVASALAGLDMTMPGDGLHWQDGQSLWGGTRTQAVLNGSIPMERIHDMATRIVATWYQLGQDNKTMWSEEGPNFSSWTNDEIGKIHHGSDDKMLGVVNKFVDTMGTGDAYHGWLAREIAQEGIVLVKNVNKTLPLTPKGWTDYNKPLYNPNGGKFQPPVAGVPTKNPTKPKPAAKTTTEPIAEQTSTDVSLSESHPTATDVPAVDPYPADSSQPTEVPQLPTVPDVPPTDPYQADADVHSVDPDVLNSVIYPSDLPDPTEVVPDPYQSSHDAYPADPQIPKRHQLRQESSATTKPPTALPTFNVAIFGEDAGPGKGPNACDDRGCNQGTLGSGWGSGAVDFIYLITPIEGLQLNFDKDAVNISVYDTNALAVSPETVEDQDLCIVFVNADGGEGYIASDGI